MNTENDILDPSVNNNNGGSANLPNATAVLVLGIISIVVCFAGLITGIIALIMHKRDKEIYLTNPAKYEASFKNSRAGYICAIVGVCLQALIVLFYVLYFIFVFSMISNMQHY